MSKAVLISIRPKWCELIASGKKTIEVRKTAPKIPTPFKCYIYCTKSSSAEKLLFLDFYGGTPKPGWVFPINRDTALRMGMAPMNGMVIVEFVCDEVIIDERGENALLFEQEGCVPFAEQKKYAPKKTLYGWHISNLIIYDVPKKLGDFRVTCQKAYCSTTCKRYPTCGATADWRYEITHPPQSWCYVEELS